MSLLFFSCILVDGTSSSSAQARLCVLRLWPDFEGYGFNLHAEKNKQGQYIGMVDANSPAEAAGLKQHDRIVEVNDVNIGDDNHAQVVQRIKTHSGVVRILVVDPSADKYFKDNNIPVRGDMSNVKIQESDSKSEPSNPGKVLLWQPF